jgi:5-methyltetrahydrofolate--homocysteine methyltransferase
MLTTTMMQMKTIIAALAEAGLRDRIKIMIGGAPVNKAFAEEIAADAYGRNASDAVEKARSLINNAITTGT